MLHVSHLYLVSFSFCTIPLWICRIYNLLRKCYRRMCKKTWGRYITLSQKLSNSHCSETDLHCGDRLVEQLCQETKWTLNPLLYWYCLLCTFSSTHIAVKHGCVPWRSAMTHFLRTRDRYVFVPSKTSMFAPLTMQCSWPSQETLSHCPHTLCQTKSFCELRSRQNIGHVWRKIYTSKQCLF